MHIQSVMTPRSILVTGANRGIGLELIKQLAALSPAPEVIIAACRTPETAHALNEFGKSNTTVKIIKLDVEDDQSIAEACSATEPLVGPKGLNLIINNAGINFMDRTINAVTSEAMMRTFRVNTVGPTIICKTFLPLLKAAAVNTGATEQSMTWDKAAVINISSRMGSIGECKTGTLLQYRASKSALNMAAKTAGNEMCQFGILVTCINPGWVRTDMGGSTAKLGVEESAQAMISVFQTFSSESLGICYDHTGTIIPY